MRWLAILTALALATPSLAQTCDDILIFDASGGGSGSSCASYTSCSGANCPCDKTSKYVAVYNFNNAATAEDATTCGAAGTDCDLTLGGSATYDATNKASGSHALDITAETDEAYCTTCDSATYLNPADTQDFTVFCYVRPDDDTGSTNKEMIDISGGSSSGIKVYRNKGNDDLRVDWRSGGSWNTLDGGNNNFAVDEWHFFAVVMDNDTGSDYEAYLYLDGSEIDSITPADTWTRNGTPDFYIGSADNDSQEGQYDICGLVKSALSLDELCVLGTCGPGNELDCECQDGDATAWKTSTGDPKGVMGNCINSVSIACDATDLDVR